MRRCEDGVGILVAESGEQEGASEEIAPLGECGSDQICPQSAENRAAGLFRYGRTLAREAQLLLIESSCRRVYPQRSSTMIGSVAEEPMVCMTCMELMFVKS